MTNMTKDWRFSKSPHVEQGGLREFTHLFAPNTLLTEDRMQVHMPAFHYDLRPSSASM